MGKIWVVPTPLGNLEDITLRAIKVLRAVDIIAAEDSRVTAKLLKKLEISKPIVPYFEENQVTGIGIILDHAKMGEVALVSDAGTPGISDPGFKLIQVALENGVEIEVLPGASALVTALVASGLPTDKFSFLGFLAKKSLQRKKALEAVKGRKETLIVYESPHRLKDLLEEIVLILGNRKVAIGRELTKMHQEIVRMKASEALEYFQAKEVLGEITVVIEGVVKPEKWSLEQVKKQLKSEFGKPGSLATKSKILAKESGWHRDEVYQLALGLKNEN